MRLPRFVALACVLALTACPSRPNAGGNGKFLLVTTVSPIADIARHVAGSTADVEGIIPEGVDSHTFEPTPSTARLLAQADLIIVNGLHLEDPTLKIAQANARPGVEIFALGDHTITADQQIYDFSFPRTGGKPNPHLWMDVALAEHYAELIRDRLVAHDPAGASAFRANAATYLTQLRALDTAVQTAIDTIPPAKRILLTYHDSFAYFARHYGMRVIGAIQPSDFSEPSGREVARLIDQIRAEHVPAIFGSEVFPSKVLDRIAHDTGAKFEDTLRDDDLPGDAGDPNHSYVGLITYDVRTIARDLGGAPSALDKIPANPA